MTNDTFVVNRSGASLPGGAMNKNKTPCEAMLWRVALWHLATTYRRLQPSRQWNLKRIEDGKA